MPNLVAVGLAEVKWSSSPEDVLTAFSLGSCVGVAVWDPVRRAGGMAHVVLPKSPDGSPDSAPGRYADTAVRYLFRKISEIGGTPQDLKVWLAGGAHVLRGMGVPGGDIGTLNIRAVLEALLDSGVRGLRTDVGEDYGRTMRLYIGEGRVTVYSASRGEKEM